MQVTIHMNKDAVLEGDWFLICGDKKIPLYEETTSFHISKAGEYEVILINNFKKGILKYILLWIVNILIAPINILLMNTDSDWYNQIILSSANYKFKCNFKKDAEINFSIICHRFKQYISGTYSIKASSVDCDLTKLSYCEDYSNNTVNWELNKYVSKLTSMEIWIFVTLCFVCYFSKYSYAWVLIIFFSIIFALIMIGTITHTICKAKKIMSILKKEAKKFSLR